MATPAMRLKTQWFKPERTKTPEETAGAMAFITWRVGVQLLKRMRLAQFDIDAGTPYFDFLGEVLVFLLAAADRLAHARMDHVARAAFVTALVLRVADHMAENQQDLLGTPQGPAWRDRFIDLYNARITDYAECGWHEDEGPDLAFVRSLGLRLEAILPDKDRHWVMDQVMSVEAPEAVVLLRRGMEGIHNTQPRTARRAGIAGD